MLDMVQSGTSDVVAPVCCCYMSCIMCVELRSDESLVQKGGSVMSLGSKRNWVQKGT